MGRAFADILREIDAGEFYDKLSGQLSELVEAVVTERKPGELSLKIKVRPNGETSIQLMSESKVKVPERAVPPTIMFVGAGGILQRNDPRQAELPLRAIQPDDRPVRKLETA
jgi:vacuolar-type H+-ATPase subunit E/Vma4